MHVHAHAFDRDEHAVRDGHADERLDKSLKTSPTVLPAAMRETSTVRSCFYSRDVRANGNETSSSVLSSATNGIALAKCRTSTQSETRAWRLAVEDVPVQRRGLLTSMP